MMVSLATCRSAMRCSERLHREGPRGQTPPTQRARWTAVASHASRLHDVQGGKRKLEGYGAGACTVQVGQDGRVTRTRPWLPVCNSCG